MGRVGSVSDRCDRSRLFGPADTHVDDHRRYADYSGRIPRVPGNVERRRRRIAAENPVAVPRPNPNANLIANGSSTPVVSGSVSLMRPAGSQGTASCLHPLTTEPQGPLMTDLTSSCELCGSRRSLAQSTTRFEMTFPALSTRYSTFRPPSLTTYT